MSRFWSTIVHQLTPYTPGEQPKLNNLLKLNTNENPYGPSPKVLEAIALTNNDSLRKYPDPNALDLKQAIAKNFDLPTESVFVGNSSDEVLAHVFRGLLKQDRPLLFPDITYSFYPVYCALFDIAFKQVPLRPDFSINIEDFSTNNGGIIFANPNAPTGISLPLSDIEVLLQRHSNSVLVVDEAYVDFGGESAVNLISKYENLVVTQTLSKSRGLAGLRVGFALASPALIEGLERVKNSFHPYTLDALAIAGAEAAFADVAYFEECCNMVVATRERTTLGLQELGFEVLPSSANFVFVRHKSAQARELFTQLRNQGIVVRYFDKPRLDQYLRISIGTDAEMQRLMQTLAEILTQSES